MTVMNRLTALSVSIQKRYDGLSRTARVFLAAWLVIQVALLGLLWYITPKRVFEALASWADGLRDSTFGWLLLIAVIVVASFPPMIGYTTTQMTCGFAFGLRNGFLLAMLGTLLGSMAAFITGRFLMGRYARRMLDTQPALKALGHAVKKHGIGLITLIRLCPFPFSYANFFFASIGEVSAGQFFVATCGLGIKVLLHVYIGTRLYLFSDPDQRKEMDSTTRWLNTISIIVSMVLGASVGAYVYRLTMGYVSQGEVALLEADASVDEVERFLQEEDELEEEEEGRSLGPNTTSLRVARNKLAAAAKRDEDDDEADWDATLNEEFEASRSTARQQ